MEARKFNVSGMLILLTAMFFLAQMVFVGISWQITARFTVLQHAFADKLVFARYFLLPAIRFLLAQILVYAGFTYIIWYTAISVSELFSLRAVHRYILGMALWFAAAAAVLFLNAYLVPHSFFTQFLLSYIFDNAVSPVMVKYISFGLAGAGAAALLLALANMLNGLLHAQHPVRNGLTAIFAAMLIYLAAGYSFFERQSAASAATAEKPDIFIIGFDALRPDYLGYFGEAQRQATPNFDAFLRSAAVFENAYTPVARTSPSWAGILTGKYPLHNGLRENNSDLNAISVSASLPAELQKNGYETIYATDDRLFNNIDRRYGFDQIIGSDGTATDFLFFALNDFPLSNLLVPTGIGKILFPGSHGNHASAHTYDPDNFLDAVNTGLQRVKGKPVFLAVHFDQSAWPHYWFNDGLAYNATQLQRYSNAVTASDELLAKFLSLLAKHNLLKHAIVVVLSDHGITLGLHGDRIINGSLYQGSRPNMHVELAPYADNADVDMYSMQIKPVKSNSRTAGNSNTAGLFRKADYAVDTSYGYGGDLLSVGRQNRTLLAIRAYGFDAGMPHRVAGRSLLLDIAPTLLDLLHLPPLPNADGISLKEYLFDEHHIALSSGREIYFESTMSSPGITQKDINLNSVIAENSNRFFINPGNGMINLLPQYLAVDIANKQRAVMLGDWFLAYYPVSEGTRLTRKPGQSTAGTLLVFDTFRMPAYFVLVNLKSGVWITGSAEQITNSSIFKNLNKNIYSFYGQEMDVYFPKKIIHA